jgi:cobyrinic acid a,c-diamide synthase
MPIPALIVAGTHSGRARRRSRWRSWRRWPGAGCGCRVQGGAGLHRSGIPGARHRPAEPEPRHLAAGTPGAGRDLSPGVPGGGLRGGRGRHGPLRWPGATDEAGSAADLARLWDLPVVLVVDAKGPGPLDRPPGPRVRDLRRPGARRGGHRQRVGGHRHYAEYLAPAVRAGTEVEPSAALPGTRRWPSRRGTSGSGRPTRSAPARRSGDGWPTPPRRLLDLDRLIALAQVPTLPPAGRVAPRPAPPGGAVGIGPRPGVLLLLRGQPRRAPRGGGRDRAVLAAGRRGAPRRASRLPRRRVSRGLRRPLAANAPMRAAIRRFHAEGGTILAECGGMMACGRTLRDASGAEFPMWDLIPGAVRHAGEVRGAGIRDRRLGPPDAARPGRHAGPGARVPLLPARAAGPFALRDPPAPARRERGPTASRSAACWPATPTCTSAPIPRRPGASSPPVSGEAESPQVDVACRSPTRAAALPVPSPASPARSASPASSRRNGPTRRLLARGCGLRGRDRDN